MIFISRHAQITASKFQISQYSETTASLIARALRSSTATVGHSDNLEIVAVLNPDTFNLIKERIRLARELRRAFRDNSLSVDGEKAVSVRNEVRHTLNLKMPMLLDKAGDPTTFVVPEDDVFRTLND